MGTIRPETKQMDLLCGTAQKGACGRGNRRHTSYTVWVKPMSPGLQVPHTVGQSDCSDRRLKTIERDSILGEELGS